MTIRFMLLSAVLAGSLTCQAADAPATKFAESLGLRCQTPLGWCPMPAPTRVNNACFCPAPNGSIAGKVVR